MDWNLSSSQARLFNRHMSLSVVPVVAHAVDFVSGE